MLFQNFVGPTYSGASPTVDSERSVNFYVRATEVPGAKAPFVLEPTPGLSPYVTIPGASTIYQLLEAQGAAYAVADNGLWHINPPTAANGNAPSASEQIGATVAPTPNWFPYYDAATSWYRAGISAAAVGSEVFVTTYQATPAAKVIGLSTTHGVISAAGFSNPVQVIGLDGYFLALDLANQTFYTSNLNDGSTWNAANYALVNGSNDRLVALAARERELFVFGTKHTEVFYDAGSVAGSTFAWARNNNVYLEVGCAAPATVARAGESLLWLGQDASGLAVVYRLSGYTPVRISTTPLERAIQSYSGNAIQTINFLQNATAFVMQMDGQVWYVLNFFYDAGYPLTWVYSLTTGQWHEWMTYDSVNQKYLAHPARTYAFAHGKHLVAGAGNQIYQVGRTFLTDAGAPILRTRTAPHLIEERKRVFYRRFELDANVGINDDGTPFTATPSLALSYSDDGGMTYSTPQAVSVPAGNYRTRLSWPRLGHARDRVFRVTTQDQARFTLNNAFLDLQVGNS